MRADGSRAGMAAGIAFPILMFLGTTMIFSHTPDTSETTASQLAQDWVDTMKSSSDRRAIIIGSILLVLAALALIWFASAMRDRYAIGVGGPLVPFAVLAAVGVACSAAGPLAIAGGITLGDEPLPSDGTAIWYLTDLMYPMLLLVFGLAVAAFISTLLLAGRRSLPMWLVIFGWVAVLGGVLALMFLPALLTLLWFLAAGIYGVIRSPSSTEQIHTGAAAPPS